MSTRPPPPSRTARPPEDSWQSSFRSLDERYKQLQKRYNEQEKILQQTKVAQRKATAPPLGPSLSSINTQRSTSRGGAPRPKATSGGGVNSFSSARRVNQPSFEYVSSGELDPEGDRSRGSAPLARTTEDDILGDDHDYVGIPSAALPKAARVAAVAHAQAWGDSASLPDPAMIWGADGQSSMQNYVVASALYHANEELRRKLNESTTTLQTFQHELSNCRAQRAETQTRLEAVAQQLHQLVRERDLAVQKYTNASHTIADMERTLRDRVGEEEKLRFSMESQITELRSRLVIGADSNELLQKDVRSLLTETRDRTGEVMQLRSKLALAESALSSQRNVNENMLVELKSLNAQLVEDRKRLLTMTREVQAASVYAARISDLEQQVQRAQVERNTIEHDHVALMGEFVHVTENALRHAREEVGADVADWKAAAEHWERVSQLLYKDIADRTTQHLQCREECEVAQGQRDTTALQLRALKEEVALQSAKLDVVWPSHLTDARDLRAEEILSMFGRKDRGGVFLFDERRRRSAAAAAAARTRHGTKDGVGDGDEQTEEEGPLREEDSFHLAADVLGDLPADPTSAACQLQELHEANAALSADVQQLRMTNTLLQERLDRVGGQQQQAQSRMAASEAALEKREKVGHQLLEQQLDRVSFLEAQVRSLRGYHVAPDARIDQIGDNENIFELFIGQLVAAEVPEGVEVPDFFAHVFCSADFLVHETITTGSVRGLNGFFDVTASFCASMDALLCYYLRTRRLLVQLHRVRSDAETSMPGTNGQRRITDGRSGSDSLNGENVDPSLCIAESLYDTIAEGEECLSDIIFSEACRCSARPTMKGHVRLTTPSGRHLASLEFRLTARRPYTEEFLRLVQSAAATAATDKEAVVKSPTSDTPLLEWMRKTAGTSADPSLPPRSQRESPFSRDLLPTTTAKTTPRTHMQLLPTSGDDGTASNASAGSRGSAWLRGRTPSTRGGFVANLRRPSAPRSSLAVGRAGMTSFHTPPAPSFIHVDRSMLSGNASLQPGSGIATGPVTCLWIDVERLELPADMPPPVPRLSCYFTVTALQVEKWLAAPPVPRYTWAYTHEEQGRGGANMGAYGIPMPVASVTTLAAAVREPLVIFLLDADAIGAAATPAPCVWAMAVCEWDQVVQHPDVPQLFMLPLLRRDQSVVKDGYVRVSLTATTAEVSGGGVSFLSAPTPAASPTVSGTVHSPLPAPSATPVAVLPSQRPRSPPADPSTRSMEEELLRLEYDRRVSRSGGR